MEAVVGLHAEPNVGVDTEHPLQLRSSSLFDGSLSGDDFADQPWRPPATTREFRLGSPCASKRSASTDPGETA